MASGETTTDKFQDRSAGFQAERIMAHDID